MSEDAYDIEKIVNSVGEVLNYELEGFLSPNEIIKTSMLVLIEASYGNAKEVARSHLIVGSVVTFLSKSA